MLQVEKVGSAPFKSIWNEELILLPFQKSETFTGHEKTKIDLSFCRILRIIRQFYFMFCHA